MTVQDVIWIIALAGIGLIALGFMHVIRQASKPADAAATRQATHTSHVLRRWLFAALVIAFVTGSYATLKNFPIPPQHEPLDVDQVVDVISGQWYWLIEPSTVQAGSTVEFRVTSRDVNHSFALYAPDGHIITQTQAMPGYTNKLVHTFTEPGTYQVMCLEYCGVGHTPMTAEIKVVAAKEGD
ncbi:MAG: cytochrome oxidase [Halothiobacillaceae bacterium]